MRITSCGMAWRLTPWKPSQPAMKSQAMSWSRRLAVAQAAAFAGQAVQADVLGLVDDRRAGGLVRVHQVVLDLGLAVDGDGLAGQRLEIDAPALAVEGQLDAVVDQPLAIEPRADADLVEQIDGALLEQAGADAGAQVLGRAPAPARLRRCRPARAAAPAAARRPASDDPDLGAHA
jgi:hypothetical protein